MKNKIELLSPVGDFECLKAAVQNGADCVYFGANLFSARASAKNFDMIGLQKAIEYAKLRGVKTNLTLNILIKNNEFEEAFNLAKKAYEFGIDAIIVQDLGLACLLIKAFPDLAIHASTQMSVHNLEGALKLQKLGFKRVVLSRELSFEEIEYITKNIDIEVECFIHGALCISYSGQCLASSMIGGRSGNRGRCAQTCRLPYELLENNKTIDKGYLLSPRDLCGLDYLPSLIKSNVTCLKIEGRMKSPEYVATVTKIYRKYIDLVYSDKEYKVSSEDKKELMQVFNRGSFSHGHLDSTPNKNLIFKEKPNNMGLYLGTVEKFNKDKGYISLKLNEPISIGDTVSLEKESGSYNISELMLKSKNIKTGELNQFVTIGRMKGNIHIGDKIYKLSSKELTDKALESFENENKKVKLNCEVTIKKNTPISIRVFSNSEEGLYSDLDIKTSLDVLPIDALNQPLDEEKVLKQINKLGSTHYEFSNIKINLDNGLFLPSFKSLNELRRIALDKVTEYALNKIHRSSDNCVLEKLDISINTGNANREISLLLNNLDIKNDYSKLIGIDNVYIPLKFFNNSNYNDILKTLNSKFKTYIYLPTIIKSNYIEFSKNTISKAVNTYKIQGFVISNLSNFELLKDWKDFEVISNYTLNVFNNRTISELKNLGISKYTISPESDKASICDNNILENEIIVYGNTPIMNMSYCLLGNSNKCYKECTKKCNSKNIYELKDRLGMKFKIIPDNTQTITTIYNCKTTSISPKDFNITSCRIDILNESINEINTIIQTVKNEQRFEGEKYTNGNLNREI
ncbi:MAG: U32 family peptidase [Clostridia bacterium]|nr:U32 family peptidase [Clostridia bacterium]